MAKIKIEKYKGFEIYYCTSNEWLECANGENEAKSVSLTAIKEKIDKFLKKNFSRVPAIYKNAPITIYGIHNNGNLMVEHDGEKEHISRYGFDNIYEDTPENRAVIEQIKLKEEAVEKLQSEINELSKQKTPFDVKGLRAKYE